MKRTPYLKSLSATLLAAINLIFAAVTFFFLFRTVFTFGTFVGTMIRSFQLKDYSMIPEFFQETLSSLNLSSYLEQITDGASLAFEFGFVHLIVSAVLVAVTSVLLPVLNILNGIGSVTLRTRGKGSRMIQVVHVIYCILNILSILFTIFLVILLIIKGNVRDSLKSANSGNFLIIMITLGIVVVIFLIAQLMVYSYNKDIAVNMSFITSDVQGATDIYLDNNHLSGLSIFFGIILLFPAAGAAYLLYQQYSIYLLLFVVLLCLNCLKYFLVAAANRGLKKTIQQRSRRSRR